MGDTDRGRGVSGWQIRSVRHSKKKRQRNTASEVVREGGGQTDRQTHAGLCICVCMCVHHRYELSSVSSSTVSSKGSYVFTRCCSSRIKSSRRTYVLVCV
jgi:hypothetical protein